MSRQPRVIHIAIYHPAPDNPPQHPRILGVFASEAGARNYIDEEYGRLYSTSYCTVERFEVKP